MTSLEQQVFFSTAMPLEVVVDGKVYQATPCKLCGQSLGWLLLGTQVIQGWNTEVDLVVAVVSKYHPPSIIDP
jgi:hypothetical protein